MLEGKGRLVVQTGKDGRPSHAILYIPTDVLRDSKFPLTPGDVTVRIRLGQTLEVVKYEDRNSRG